MPLPLLMACYADAAAGFADAPLHHSRVAIMLLLILPCRASACRYCYYAILPLLRHAAATPRRDSAAAIRAAFAMPPYAASCAAALRHIAPLPLLLLPRRYCWLTVGCLPSVQHAGCQSAAAIRYAATLMLLAGMICRRHVMLLPLLQCEDARHAGTVAVTCR